MNILRIAAFCDGNLRGGNPAGVVIADHLPAPARMQKMAAEVGFSETVFASADGDGWRVRYYSPESEVPFCGHATIALGAALAMRSGNGVFALHLNDTSITVEGKSEGGTLAAALQSPPTASEAACQDVVDAALELFGYRPADLDSGIAPAIVSAGARHLLLCLKTRRRLSDMVYQLSGGRDLMKALGLVTINLVYAETPQRFHSRNAFASGGVYEDPATGAAAAALAGYLRDLKWPHNGHLSIVQGEDMGIRSLLRADFADEPGTSVRVSGTARVM